MISILFFLICISRMYGFHVPAIVDKETGEIGIYAWVDTRIQDGKLCQLKFLIHTYSPFTWITTSLTSYSRHQGENTRSESFDQLHWSEVFTEDNEPPECQINPDKLEELPKEHISFMSYGKRNYETRLDYHVYSDQRIILTNEGLQNPFLHLPLTLAIVNQLMQIVPPRQIRPRQRFSGVLGLAPVWMNEDLVNSLLCVLGSNNFDPSQKIQQILALDINIEGGSTVGIGQQLHPEADWQWIQLPIHHKRGSRAPFHKYWTFDADINIQYPNHIPIISIREYGSEMMIDTTTEFISLPVSVFNKLFPEDLDEDNPNLESLYEFIYGHAPKPCDQIINLLPSINFRFTRSIFGPAEPLIITLEPSLLIKRESQDQSQCKTLLRRQADVDFDFWKIGVPFLYKVYVELFFEPGQDNEIIPVVKLFDKNIN